MPGFPHPSCHAGCSVWGVHQSLEPLGPRLGEHSSLDYCLQEFSGISSWGLHGGQAHLGGLSFELGVEFEG